jgi:sortase A
MRVMIRGIGELCITAGLLLLFFVAYELWGTGAYTAHQQNLLEQQLNRTWAQMRRSAEAAPEVHTAVHLGSGIALIRIPRLGKSYHYVVVEGVDTLDLEKGPGHYPGTAMPGQVGNFVVSGHRTTYLAPFNGLDRLRRGDEIIVDTEADEYIYRVTGHDIVLPTNVSVIDPVPSRPKARPTQALITLTTCNPKYSAAQRLIVFGTLQKALPRVVG